MLQKVTGDGAVTAWAYKMLPNVTDFANKENV